jgi:hypothetical protein
VKFGQNAERIATQRDARGEANFSMADWAATRALEDRAGPICRPRESASGFAASQESTPHAKSRHGSHLRHGQPSPCASITIGRRPRGHHLIYSKRRPPPSSLSPDLSSLGRQAARRSGGFPGPPPSRQSGDQVWRCRPAACHVAGATALVAAREVTFPPVTDGVSRCNEP